MSQENVDIVRTFYDAWKRGDMEYMLDRCRSDIVIVQPPEVPDSKAYEGPEGLIESFEDWPKQWDKFEADLVDVIDVDERHVISVNRQSLAARGVDFEQDVHFLHTIDEGMTSRVDMFFTLEEARAAAQDPPA